MVAFPLNEMSLISLVEIYNSVAEKAVKKFSSKAEGLRRTEAALAAARMEVVYGDNGGYLVQVAGSEVDPEEDATPEPQPEAKGDKPGRGTYAEDAVITVVALPKVRDGSFRASRQAALVTGTTVGAYLDAAHAANGGRRSRHKYHSDLLRLVKSGAITIG